MKTLTLALAMLVSGLVAPVFCAEEKVPLEEPKQPDLIASLHGQPDGVLSVKTNDDGSFKSLVVKASVEIEDALGAQKGKQLARKEAETKCKQALSKWLEEYCTFAETGNKVTTIVTKGESAKDAAGNVVKLRNQQGTETKTVTETSGSLSAAVLRGMIVLTSEVTDAKEPEYILVMGISQETMKQAGMVAKALATKSSSAASGAKAAADPGRPAAEKKVNPAAAGF
jgi:hypothetical protein